MENLYVNFSILVRVLMSRQGRNVIKQKIVNIIMKYHGCAHLLCNIVHASYNVDGIQYYQFIFKKKMLCVYSLKKKIRNIFYKFDLINNVNGKTFKIAKIKFYVSENFDRKIFFSRFIIFCKKKKKIKREHIIPQHYMSISYTHNKKQCNLVKN